MGVSEFVGYLSIVIAAGAAVASAYSIYRADVASSAAALVAIQADFRAEWRNFIGSETEDERQHSFGDLITVFELSCALYEQQAWRGICREIIDDYMTDTLRLIIDSPDTCARVSSLVSSPRDLKYLRIFLRARGLDKNFATVVVPERSF